MVSLRWNALPTQYVPVSHPQSPGCPFIVTLAKYELAASIAATTALGTGSGAPGLGVDVWAWEEGWCGESP